MYISYITNFENNKILTNDEIFIRLVLFNKYIKILTGFGPIDIIIKCDNYIEKQFKKSKKKNVGDALSFLYKKQIDEIEVDEEVPINPNVDYDKFINQYFGVINDYKIKAIEYDKIKGNQDETIELTKQLTHMKNKYSKLEGKYKNLETEYTTLIIQDETIELTEQLSDMQNKYSELEAKYKELEEYNTMLIMQNRLLNK